VEQGCGARDRWKLLKAVSSGEVNETSGFDIEVLDAPEP
jgi:hypothetical protein